MTRRKRGASGCIRRPNGCSEGHPHRNPSRLSPELQEMLRCSRGQVHPRRNPERGKDARHPRRCWRGTRKEKPSAGSGRRHRRGWRGTLARAGSPRTVPVPGHVPRAKLRPRHWLSLTVTPVGTCLAGGGDLQAQPGRLGTSPSRGHVALGRCWPCPQGWGRDAGPPRLPRPSARFK